ncbi:hypothetical protein K0M31_008137 [Melipona bicolor]|uniref:Uncharacterized protein n=1 Tax=Melipona bicolor TaxID=60889 RepID=A0AA40KKA7_9HYME|nr:hypothetical protein K0M31_008137 [Melipona bicolor]
MAINCGSSNVLFCHEDDLESYNEAAEASRKVSDTSQKIKTCCKILKYFSPSSS